MLLRIFQDTSITFIIIIHDNNIIMKPDKGNGIVIVDKDDYNKKMEDILSDTNRLVDAKDR